MQPPQDSALPKQRRRGAAPLLAVAAVCAALALPACKPATPTGETQAAVADATDKGAAKSAGVSLKPEEMEKGGIRTATVTAVSHVPDVAGYAVVQTREAIAQAIADLATAAAVARASHAALARMHGLAGTPGAMPLESQESAERQAAVDEAALMLARRRLSAVYGEDAPWKDDSHSPALTALAAGANRLARVTFPLGVFGGAPSPRLSFSHLGDGPTASRMPAQTVWNAPADATVPGRSFFAILAGHDAAEGERLLAHASFGSAESGVVVPTSAALITAGKYWCYVEEQPGTFVRTQIDPDAPVEGGYFVRGIASGAQIVTSGAGLLLARETNPSTAAD
jgi:hypothetical protein